MSEVVICVYLDFVGEEMGGDELALAGPGGAVGLEDAVAEEGPVCVLVVGALAQLQGHAQAHVPDHGRIAHVQEHHVAHRVREHRACYPSMQINHGPSKQGPKLKTPACMQCNACMQLTRQDKPEQQKLPQFPLPRFYAGPHVGESESAPLSLCGCIGEFSRQAS